MAIDFIGYPNTGTVRFYLGGSVIDLSQVTYEMNLRKPLVDGGYVYGFREYYKIPFSVIGNHPAIRVEASGRNGGKAYAILSNLQLIAK